MARFKNKETGSILEVSIESSIESMKQNALFEELLAEKEKEPRRTKKKE